MKIRNWQITNAIIQSKKKFVYCFDFDYFCLFSFEIMRRAILKFGMLLLILGLAISNSLHKSFFLVHAFSDGLTQSDPLTDYVHAS